MEKFSSDCSSWTYCQVSQWLRLGFGLVIGFTGYLKVVTTNNYTLLLIYTIYNHSTLIFSVYLHWFSQIYNTGSIKVPINHTLPISLCYSTHKVFKSHVKSSQAELLYSSVVLVPIRTELTAHGSRYIATERTWTYSKHISHDCYSASLLARRSDLQETQLPLLLRVRPCLQSSCLAKRSSNSLQ
jgi:hypothetical protein